MANDKFSHDVNISKYRYYLRKLVDLNKDYTCKTDPWFNIGRILYKESKLASANLKPDEEFSKNQNDKMKEIREGTHITFNDTQ